METIIKNLIIKNPNDFDLGKEVKININSTSILFKPLIKQYPNNYDLGKKVRKLYLIDHTITQ
jgi:hypothetical protein